MQALLNLPVPEWHHHGLLTDDAGKRLAKRHDPLTIRGLRDAGKSAAEVRALAGTVARAVDGASVSPRESSG